jgi:hypothetical protein
VISCNDMAMWRLLSAIERALQLVDGGLGALSRRGTGFGMSTGLVGAGCGSAGRNLGLDVEFEGLDGLVEVPAVR